MEDPAQAKGVVRREVTRLVTPGTLTDEALLDEATANHVAAVQFIDDASAVIAFAELSTGSMHVAALPTAGLADELARIAPRELLFVETADGKVPDRIARLVVGTGCATTPRPAWQFRTAEATETLLKQFQVVSLSGFGIAADDPVIGPAGAIVSYLLETQQAHSGRLPHLSPPRRHERADHLIIDQVSLRSLEVERTLRSGDAGSSLLGTLQDCRSPMGKRLLRTWLCFPLTDIDKIEARQAVVATVVHDSDFSAQLARELDKVQDVQRIGGRVAIGRPSPRDIVALGRSLADLPRIIDLLDQRPSLADHHARLTAIVPSLSSLATLLTTACVDSPPGHLREGGLIRDGHDAPLDELRSLQRDSNQHLAAYQARLSQESGIGSLKLGYNKVFGYYIEITNVHREKVPPTFTRKQTLKNCERYVTPELKEFEDRVLGAASKAVAREQALFDDLCAKAAERLNDLHEYAQIIAELDVLACFGRRAARYRYTRPKLVREPVLQIIDGRHPVLDQILADQFVPNDTELGPGQTLALITGPNMAGKSTYIRQTALLTLLAHTGSFVPATSATVGLTDRIFTRIGASDEIHMGQSTFMVEMTETANICHHVSPRSLVVLDEIGRGTSTLDGLALAWAIAEHLAAKKCRTLFATHYHELTQLSQRYDNIANLNVTVREWAEQIIFLHRISPGSADRSYGIHVAQIAGLPRPVVQRARELLDQLQVHHEGVVPGGPANGSSRRRRTEDDEPQLELFAPPPEHPAVTTLKTADLNSLSPLAAFDLLRRLKDELDAQPPPPPSPPPRTPRSKSPTPRS
jgi:DNA mismatch repair protein MutS